METFNKRFWNESTGCLYDVVENGHADGSLRPNQIFAVSLPHSMLSPEKARSVVQTVQTELLTPLGLRTLSRHDPRYRAHYEGGVTERDTAYHLGTVWPWLMGPFITAYLKVNQRSEAARQQGRNLAGRFLRARDHHRPGSHLRNRRRRVSLHPARLHRPSLERRRNPARRRRRRLRRRAHHQAPPHQSRSHPRVSEGGQA